MRSTRTLARWALGTTVLLVTLGGYTRGSGSGYGCKNRWPLCENGLLGGLLPRFEYHMIVEWTHRWVAAIVGVLIILTAIAAWRSRPRNPRVVWPATVAIVVVGIQAWLGRLIVKGGLDRDLVSVHLTISMVIVGLLVLVVVASDERSFIPANRGWQWMVIAAAATTYGVLLLGSIVHNLYFAGWPLQADAVIPDLSNKHAALHFSHRLVAGLGFAYLMYLAARARKLARPERFLITAAASAFAVNVALGAVHVFTEVTSAAVVALHLFFATVAWATAVAATAVASGWKRERSTTT